MIRAFIVFVILVLALLTIGFFVPEFTKKYWKTIIYVFLAAIVAAILMVIIVSIF